MLSPPATGLAHMAAAAAAVAPPATISPRRVLAQGVHVCGPFRSNHVVVKVADGVRNYPEAVVAGAELHWQSELARRPGIFDGPVWCLLSFEDGMCPDGASAGMPADCIGEGTQNKLQLELQKSSFRYVLYTHMSDAGRQMAPSERAGACGLMALAETQDQFLVFGKRSSRLACMPGYWHCVPAGQLDSPDPQAVLRKELEEETGCGWESVTHAELLAVMDTGAEQGHKTELVFRLSLAMDAAGLYKRYTAAEDRFEHECLVFVRAPRQFGCTADVTPCAAAGGRPTAIAAPAFPMVEMEAFLNDDYMLTDVSRRALELLCELRAAGHLS